MENEREEQEEKKEGGRTSPHRIIVSAIRCFYSSFYSISYFGIYPLFIFNRKDQIYTANVYNNLQLTRISFYIYKWQENIDVPIRSEKYNVSTAS
jgi:hypothetical protein